jgi:hypothetical protein
MRGAIGLTAGLLSWLLLPATASADTPEVLREGLADLGEGRLLAADPAQARACFRRAAAHFATAVQQGVRTPGLFLNLGDAHFLADQLPEAIFAFRRGLRLDPDDRTLRANLDYARLRVGLPQGVDKGSPSRGWWSLTAWRRNLALACYVLAIPAFFWVAATRSSRAIAMAVILVVACAALNAYSWALEQKETREAQDHPLVVIRDDQLPLRRGNGPSYAAHPDWPHLPAGLEARRLAERGGWLQIEVPGGAVGWVPRDAALVDED